MSQHGIPDGDDNIDRSASATESNSAGSTAAGNKRHATSLDPQLKDSPFKKRQLEQTRITICLHNGREYSITISNDEAFDKFRRERGVDYLLDGSNTQILHFSGLTDGGKYYAVAATTTTQQTVTDDWKRKPIPFDYETLPAPASTVRPLLFRRPKKPGRYICSSTFKERLFNNVLTYFAQNDASETDRVPPMALVGCSRSGKTAALEEIAVALPAFLAANGQESVATILVTFNDYSPIHPTEDGDPLQALLRRLVFAVSKRDKEPELDIIESEYKTFRHEYPTLDPFCIENWMKDEKIVLLVDELNNLPELGAKGGNSAAFGDFFRSNFLAKRGRYLIFSSHELGAVETFGSVVDTSKGSSRKVALQRLPFANDLRDVIYLNPAIRGALEAIYYGLLPGLIVDQKNKRGCNEKMKAAIREFNALEGLRPWVVSIFASLISGSIECVPRELHCLLTTRPVDDADDDEEDDEELAKVSWVPFILRHVMKTIVLDKQDWLYDIKRDVAWLCKQLRTANKGSGEGVEYLFCITYLARSVARLPFKDFLLAAWTANPNVEVRFNPFDPIAANCSFEACSKWSLMKKGAVAPGRGPTIGLYLPGDDHFRSFDVVAAYFEDFEMVDCRAFQLKEMGSRTRKTW